MLFAYTHFICQVHTIDVLCRDRSHVPTTTTIALRLFVEDMAYPAYGLTHTHTHTYTCLDECRGVPIRLPIRQFIHHTFEVSPVSGIYNKRCRLRPQENCPFVYAEENMSNTTEAAENRCREPRLELPPGLQEFRQSASI